MNLHYITIFVLLHKASSYPTYQLNGTVTEQQQPHVYVLNIRKSLESLNVAITDEDMKPYAYKLSAVDLYFEIDTKMDYLVIKNTIDIEQICKPTALSAGGKSCNILSTVLNIWHQSNVIKASITIQITVVDINDHEPKFQSDTYTKSVSEVIFTSSQKIELPQAVDLDFSLKYSNLTYALQSLDSDKETWVMTIEANGRPYLQLLEPLDYETKSRYEFKLIASDIDNHSATAKVIIIVKDINDNAPQFEQKVYTANVAEDSEVGTMILKVIANDKDITSQLRYEMGYISPSSEIKNFFQVNTSGEIFLIKQLDYERSSEYVIPVIVLDDEYTAETSVVVKVENVNDSPPKFIVNPAVLEIMENHRNREAIGGITVKDDDSDITRDIECFPEASNYFTLEKRDKIDSKSIENHIQYDIIPSGPIDRELINNITEMLTCHDNKPPVLTSTIFLTIHVIDENDNAPEFSVGNYTTSISELDTMNKPIIKLNAADPDYADNGKVTYFIKEASDPMAFRIEPNTGQLIAVQYFDREVTSHYQLVIEAKDGGRPIPLSNTIIVNVFVEDVNDNQPEFMGPLLLSIEENQSVGTLIGHLIATDKDDGDNGRVVFSFSRNHFKIEEKLKLYANGTLTSAQIFDREKDIRYCFDVTITDQGADIVLHTTVHLCVEIRDQNDHEPRFVLPVNESTVFRVSLMDDIFHIVTKVTAKDEDVLQNGEIVYSMEEIEPSTNKLKLTKHKVFSINDRTGEIEIAIRLTNQHRGLHMLRVMATDGGQPARSKTLMVKIVVDDKPENSASIFHWVGQRNVLVVIVLTSVSAVLAFLLILGIIVMIKPCRTRQSMSSVPTFSKERDVTLCSRQMPNNSSPQSCSNLETKPVQYYGDPCARPQDQQSDSGKGISDDETPAYQSVNSAPKYYTLANLQTFSPCSKPITNNNNNYPCLSPVTFNTDSSDYTTLPYNFQTLPSNQYAGHITSSNFMPVNKGHGTDYSPYILASSLKISPSSQFQYSKPFDESTFTYCSGSTSKYDLIHPGPADDVALLQETDIVTASASNSSCSFTSAGRKKSCLTSFTLPKEQRVVQMTERESTMKHLVA